MSTEITRPDKTPLGEVTLWADTQLENSNCFALLSILSTLMAIMFKRGTRGRGGLDGCMAKAVGRDARSSSEADERWEGAG